MLAFLLGLFRLVFLFGKGHRAVVLENLALRQQLCTYQRKQKRVRRGLLRSMLMILRPR